MEDKYIVAVEIGSSKIRGALASVDSAGILNLVAAQEEQMTDSVRYGQVKNIDEVSNRIDAIRAKLENSKAISPRRISGVYVGLGGLSVGAADATQTIRFNEDTDITASIVDQLKSQTIGSRFSDKETYQIVPCEYQIDTDVTNDPVGFCGRSLKGSFKVIEGNPGIKSNINRVFHERLSLDINGYIVSPMALADTLLTAEEKKLGCMLVDFGAETTTTIIFSKGKLAWLATLPMGSRNITRDLVALKYVEEQAEAIKCSVGVSNASAQGPRIANQYSIDQPEINNFIQARTSEIIANIMAQIEYAGLKAADLAGGIVICGGGSRMKGFSDMITDQSKMKVRIGVAPRNNIRISDSSILADDFVDVLSLLIAAAAKNPKSCLSDAEFVTGYDEDHPRPYYGDAGYDDENDERESRIGMEEDDDIFTDGPKKKKKEKAAKPAKPSVFQKLADRMKNLLNDDEKDRYDDEDE